MRSLDVAALLYVKPGESLGGIKSQNQDGAKIQCLSRAEKHTADTELCFDAATGVLARVRDREGTRGLSNPSGVSKAKTKTGQKSSVCLEQKSTPLTLNCASMLQPAFLPESDTNYFCSRTA